MLRCRKRQYRSQVGFLTHLRMLATILRGHDIIFARTSHAPNRRPLRPIGKIITPAIEIRIANVYIFAARTPRCQPMKAPPVGKQHRNFSTMLFPEIAPCAAQWRLPGNVQHNFFVINHPLRPIRRKNATALPGDHVTRFAVFDLAAQLPGSFKGGARYPEVRLLLENNELSNRRSWHGSRIFATIAARTP